MVPCPICKTGSFDTLPGMIEHINDAHYESDVPVDLYYREKRRALEEKARFDEMMANGGPKIPMIPFPVPDIGEVLTAVQPMSGYQGSSEVDSPFICAPRLPLDKIDE